MDNLEMLEEFRRTISSKYTCSHYS